MKKGDRRRQNKARNRRRSRAPGHRGPKKARQNKGVSFLSPLMIDHLTDAAVFTAIQNVLGVGTMGKLALSIAVTPEGVRITCDDLSVEIPRDLTAELTQTAGKKTKGPTIQ